MAFYDAKIYVGKPASLWDVSLGSLIPGALQGWDWEYGADTQRATHPPRPATFGFETRLVGDVDEPNWTDGDRVHFRISYAGQAEFTLFVGSLERPRIRRGTGVTDIAARAYGTLAFLPETALLTQQDNNDTGDLFVELLEAAGLPAVLRRADSTMDRVLLQYQAVDANDDTLGLRVIPELQRVVDSEGPPAVWYQAYDGAIFAHARGMLTDALQVGPGQALQPRGALDVVQNLRNIVNSVDFDVVEVVGGVASVTGSIPFDDPDSVLRYGERTLRRQPFGALAEDDVRDLARLWVSQYAFGLTERGFDLRVQENNIATVIGDGSDFSGMYPGRPIIIFDGRGNAALGRVSRAKVSGRGTSISAQIDTDSYVAEELIFVPASLTVQLVSGEAYSVTIPPAVGGRAPITYALDGALPNGATGFDEDTRILSGMAPAGTITQTADFEATDSTVPVFRLDGLLTEIGTGPNVGPGDWNGCGMTKSGGIVYAGLLNDLANEFHLYTVDLSTGVLTEVGSGHNPGARSWEGCGMVAVAGIVYVGLTDNSGDSFHLYTVNTSTGILTEVGSGYGLGTGIWYGCGMAEANGVVYTGINNLTGDVFNLYIVDLATGVLTEIGSGYGLGSNVLWLSGGMTESNGIVYAGLVDATNEIYHLYRVNTSTGILTEAGGGYGLGGPDWEGCGMVEVGNVVYTGLLDDQANEFHLYTNDGTARLPLTADLTLTLEISPMATPPPPPTPGGFNWRFDTLAAFETYFTIPQGSGSGHWEADTNAGSTSTGNTGPGTNNADDFVFAKASPGSAVNSTREANGIAQVVSGEIATLTDRDIIIRYIAAGRFGDGTGGGISVEGRTTGGAWIEIAFLHGWAYAGTRNQGDTVTDNDGVDFDVAQDGGWRDATVSVPDTYDELRLAPTYTATGQRARQDIALHSIRSA